MTPELISELGLLICIAPVLVHAPEVLSPMLALLDAARDAGPQGKEVTSRDFIVLMLFAGRQVSLATWSVAATVVYGLTLGLEARAPLHCMFSVLSVLFALVNLNHAGIPGLGERPRASRHGRNVGILFGPVWAVSAVLNVWAFVGAS